MPASTLILVAALAAVAAAAPGCHVAIVGAGAAGTATAYHLSRVAPHCTATVLEQSDRVGGRVRLLRIADRDVEVGASVFVRQNALMLNSTRDFGLELYQPFRRPGSRLAIFDGDGLVFAQSSHATLSLAKMVWRYGMAPMHVKSLAADALAKFLGIYDDDEPFGSAVEALERLGLAEDLYVDMERMLVVEQGIAQPFPQEFVAGLTRNNYGLDVAHIHALAGLICMIAGKEDVFAVRGGNSLVFERFLEEAKAELRLGTRVAGVDGTTVTLASGEEIKADYVAVAAPGVLSNRTVPYNVVHVAVVRGVLNPAYFGTDEMPTDIWTTKGAPFSSLSVLHTVGDEVITKIFAMRELSDHQLDKMFHSRSEIRRVKWNAYPYMVPLGVGQGAEATMVEVGRNLFHVSGFEPAISTMETMVLAGRNVARIIARREQEKGGMQ